MDFRDGPADAEFRAAAREVLERAVADLPGPEPQTVEARAPYWRQFQRAIADAGYAGLAWPREYGGRDASLTEQAIFLQEYDRANAPDRLALYAALVMIASAHSASRRSPIPIS